MTGPLQDAAEVEISDLAGLHAWLMANASRDAGVWLVTYKKGDLQRYVAYPDIVDELLCVGWVDSLPRAKDDLRTMLWISPRKPGSNWSRVNKEKVARLTAEGRMQPTGLAAVERARIDGSWSALDDVENGVVPDDLAQAFEAEPGTRAVWDGFPRSVRRGALEQLLNAKQPATREKRIGVIVASCAAGERPFQWKGRR